MDNRRAFLKSMMLTALALPSTGMGSDGGIRRCASNEGMNFRRLGRTGIKISEISLGGSPVPDWALMQQLAEQGVNYIDSSHTYQNGNSERMIGRLLKQMGRDRIHVGTKFHVRGNWDTEGIIKSVDGSLKRLGTDYLDVLLIHGPDSPEQLTDDRVLEAFERMKKDGKFRFKGFSCHGNHAPLVEAAAESNQYDVIQLAYNIFDVEGTANPETKMDDYLGQSGLRRLIRLARTRDIGIIAMKTLKSGSKFQDLGFYAEGVYLHQAMIRWVLDNPNVSSVVTEIMTFEQMEEDLAAVRKPLSRQEKSLLLRHVAENAGDYCHGCGTCLMECPADIPVPDILRFRAYLEIYGKKEMARRAYSRLSAGHRADSCRDCAACERNCGSLILSWPDREDAPEGSFKRR